jgi:hypothetical protein
MQALHHRRGMPPNHLVLSVSSATRVVGVADEKAEVRM